MFDLDAGAMASVGNVRVGLAARNLRQPEFRAGGADPTARQAGRGVAFYVPRSPPAGVYGPFSLAFDADLTTTATALGDQRQAAVGSEQWWGSGRVGTRLGVHWSTLGAAQPAIIRRILTVKLPRSAFAEGHVTKGEEIRDSGWGLGLE